MTQRSPRLKRSMELLLIGTAAGVAVACGSHATDMAGDLAEEVGDMLTDAGIALEETGAEMLDGAADPQPSAHDAQAPLDAQATSDALATSSQDEAATVTQMLTEAGAVLMSDAGELLRDAGAVLHDAGADAHDSGSQMARDASAQSCATCNGAGALHALPASENPTQQLGGSRARGSWTRVSQAVPQTGYTLVAYYAALADGPLVLTDVERVSASGPPMSIYAAPKGSACVVPPTSNGLAYVLPAQARLLLLNTASSQTHGAHLNVRADEMACALAVSGADSVDLPNFAVDPGNAAITWSGYRLYE